MGMDRADCSLREISEQKRPGRRSKIMTHKAVRSSAKKCRFPDEEHFTIQLLSCDACDREKRAMSLRLQRFVAASPQLKRWLSNFR
jgi:hypothetical protein